MRITAYITKAIDPINAIMLESSSGLTATSDNLNWLLESLYTDFPIDNTLKVFWDLDATIAPLLRLLGKDKCKKLYETNRCYCAPFSIFYIPSKVFSIKPVFSQERANFYDLEQYFPEREAPETTEEIAELGEKLLEALEKMNLYPKKLTSPVAIWEQEVMNYLNLPTAWDMPKEAAEYAWYCSGKLWTEAYQIGYWR